MVLAYLGVNRRPKLIPLIAKGNTQIASDVSVDVLDVSEVLLTVPISNTYLMCI